MWGSRASHARTTLKALHAFRIGKKKQFFCSVSKGRKWRFGNSLGERVAFEIISIIFISLRSKLFRAAKREAGFSAFCPGESGARAKIITHHGNKISSSCTFARIKIFFNHASPKPSLPPHQWTPLTHHSSSVVYVLVSLPHLTLLSVCVFRSDFTVSSLLVQDKGKRWFGFKTTERISINANTNYTREVSFRIIRCFAWGTRAQWVIAGRHCKEHQQYHCRFYTKETLICWWNQAPSTFSKAHCNSLTWMCKSCTVCFKDKTFAHILIYWR